MAGEFCPGEGGQQWEGEMIGKKDRRVNMVQQNVYTCM
jgi:hypothetical protein